MSKTTPEQQKLKEKKCKRSNNNKK